MVPKRMISPHLLYLMQKCRCRVHIPCWSSNCGRNRRRAPSSLFLRLLLLLLLLSSFFLLFRNPIQNWEKQQQQQCIHLVFRCYCGEFAVVRPSWRFPRPGRQPPALDWSGGNCCCRCCREIRGGCILLRGVRRGRSLGLTSWR